MSLTNTTIANGAALQVFPPTGGDGGLPTNNYAVLGVTSFVCNGATPVTVAYPGLTANSFVLPTLGTAGGTVGALPAVKTVTPGTGFTIAGTALDTSTYLLLIIG
jgi:hypothetical protein